MGKDLHGKVVLITGASSGIGRAAALAYAAEGARVAVTSHSDHDGARRTVDDVRAAGGEPLLVHYDLTDERVIRNAVDRVVAQWGGIDVLVTAAMEWGDAIPRPGRPALPFEDVPAKLWQEVFRTTVDGTYLTIQAVLPAMRHRAWGRIVLLGAGLAETGLVGAGAYGAAKMALFGLARSLAPEVGADGILVNLVVPGQTLTENVLRNMPEAARAAKAASLPSRRMSTPEDVAAAVVFLGSAANGNVTGETLRVTGGS